MMSLASHLVCAWFVFALPAYATYKALARSPGDLRPLAVYWTVLGLFVALEHSLGLFLSWFPFYWELRTVFLLYLALPHTQGSVYVYNSLLEPWLSKNEAEFDHALASAQSNAIAFCRARLTALADLVWRSLNGGPPAGDTQKSVVPVDHLKGLWTTYGPTVLAAFTPKDTTNEHAHGATPAQSAN